MVIDIDPDFGAANEVRRGSEATLRGGIESNGHIEILRFAQRRLEECATGQKTIFFQQAVFVSDHHCLAEFGEGKGKPELAAERVAVGPHVTQDSKRLVRAKDGPDFRESTLRHSVSAAGGSICCRISKTRAPRSMESSR